MIYKLKFKVAKNFKKHFNIDCEFLIYQFFVRLLNCRFDFYVLKAHLSLMTAKQQIKSF